MSGQQPVGRTHTGINSVEPSSFRDPSGQVIRHRGQILRRINRIYRPHYDLLIDSGLYERLTADRQLIRHEPIEITEILSEEVYRIIKPEPVPFISYPYEWCFGQLKDAALLTLNIQRTAIEFGMSLKDASAFNVQFINARPILIDTLSFETYAEGSPWVAYSQFCRHFLAPLSLMSYLDVRLNTMLRSYIDGLPLDLAVAMLPLRAKLKPSLLTHLVLHSRSQQRYAGQSRASAKTAFGRTAMLGLIDSLESAVKQLAPSRGRGVWTDYYAVDGYDADAANHKKQQVRHCLDQVKPRTVWDLGANDGRYSALAAERGITTIAFDLDPQAVENAYDNCRSNGCLAMLPLVLDLTNPSPGLGWDNRERQSLRQRGPADLIMALALVHHLAIGNNLPLEKIAETFSSLGHWLLIEYVPKSDPQVRRLLASREDIFDRYSRTGFETAFAKHFLIRSAEQIQKTERIVYLLERR